MPAVFKAAAPRQLAPHTYGCGAALLLIGLLAACDCRPQSCLTDKDCAVGQGCLAGRCGALGLAPSVPTAPTLKSTLLAQPQLHASHDEASLHDGLRLVRRHELPGPAAAPPTVDATGQVWWLSSAGELFALSASARVHYAGRLPSAAEAFWLASVTHCAGRVWALRSDGLLVALERSAGRLQLTFQRQLVDGGLYAPACAEGLLWVASDVLYGLDAESGALRWVRPLSGKPSAPLAFDAAGQALVLTSTGEAWRVDAQGRVQRRDALEAVAGTAALPVAGGRWLTGGRLGRLVAREASGATAWVRRFPGAIVAGPTWNSGQLVVVCTHGGLVAAVDLQGAVRWQRQQAAPLGASPRWWQGHFVLGGRDATLYGLDLRGELRHQVQLDSRLLGFATSGELLVAATELGQLYFFARESL